MLKVKWYFLGGMDYETAYSLQRKLAEKLKRERELCGYLLFLEHPPTITFGYSLKGDEGKSELRISEKELGKRGFKIFHTDRGGKATYHGPGQLVCYLILNLNLLRLSGKRYVRKLEEVVINWLQSLGIPARRDLDYPGVWVGEKKIASVGVRIEERISRHGIAINLHPDLADFELIVPCGIKDKKMTSYYELRGKKLEYPQAIAGILKAFSQVFQVEVIAGEIPELSGQGGLDDNQGMAYSRLI